MSRIFGVVNFEQAYNVDVQLEELKTTMMHATSYFSDDFRSAMAGFGRICYNDGYPGAFLSSNFAEEYICLFNGYIIDWAQVAANLKRKYSKNVEITNPAELLSFLIIEVGITGLANLNGIFSFALWSKKKHVLWLATDRYGMRPLYYQQKGKTVRFASEIKAISINDSHLSPNFESMEETFVFGFLLGNETLYEGIKRVPPASILRFDKGGITQKRYWWFDNIEIDPNLTAEEYSRENNRLLRASINKLGAGHEAVSCFLSSGFDSRRIYLELTRSGRNITAYTVASSKRKDLYEVEFEIAKKLSQIVGTRHFAVDLPKPEMQAENLLNMYSLLDFESDEHHFIMPLLSAINPGGGINFDGLGGDILINGLFLQQDILSVIEDNNKVVDKILSFNPNMWPKYFKKVPTSEPLKERILKILNDLPDDPNKLTYFFFMTRTRREISLFPYGLISLKMESVLPYLDNDLFDFSLKIHPVLKCKTNLQERILRLDYNELMDQIPNSHYAKISTSPDDFCKPYCRPLGDFWQRAKKSIYAVSTDDILASAELKSLLSSRALIIAHCFRLFNRLHFMPKTLLDRCWSLKRIGQLADFYRLANNKEDANRRLDGARRAIFKTR